MARIYTSYFANWRRWPVGMVPIGVTRFPPKNFKEINLVSLAPSDKLLHKYKNKLIDENQFKFLYLRELEEKKLTPLFVYEVLDKATNGKDIILCCYEKSGDFCHRHILNDWLNGEGEII